MSPIAALVFLCLVAIGVVALGAQTADGYVSYDGYRVFRVFPTSAEKFTDFKSIVSSLGISPNAWDHPVMAYGGYRPNFPISITIPPESIETFTAQLEANHIPYAVPIPDFGAYVREQGWDQWANASSAMRLRSAFAERDESVKFNLSTYHSHAEINAYLRALAREYDTHVELESMGKSHEGREMLVAKIGYPKGPLPALPKPALFIDAGIHAREWITTATALYFLHHLATNYERYSEELNQVDVYVLPVLNPDGYEYSREKEPRWRKTRSGPHGEEGCLGVDANRNFPVRFGTTGVMIDNPCSDLYPGPRAFSEVETQNLAEYLDYKVKNRTRLNGYLNMHSFGNMIFYPYAHDVKTYPPDMSRIRRVANRMAAAVKRAGGPWLEVGTAADILYSSSGAGLDYAYSLGVPLSFATELTNTEYLFHLPESMIEPTAKWAMVELLELTRAVYELQEEKTKMENEL